MLCNSYLARIKVNGLLAKWVSKHCNFGFLVNRMLGLCSLLDSILGVGG